MIKCARWGQQSLRKGQNTLWNRNLCLLPCRSGVKSATDYCPSLYDVPGEYGIEDVCLSVPSIIGVNGVEKRLEERWAEEEFLAFRQAAEKMRNVLKTL